MDLSNTFVHKSASLTLDGIDDPATFELGAVHWQRKPASSRTGMLADRIRPGARLGKRTVVRAVNGMSTFVEYGNRAARPARLVTLDNGKVKAFPLGTMVADVQGYAEPTPAGGVESGVVKTPAKVRVSRKEWRGEQATGKLRTREHDMIARTNMFDRGRVNGSTTSAQGMGSVADTGKNF